MLQIPFQSKIQPIKNIAERNLAFQQLSDDEKRREIAYDLLVLVLMNDVRPAWSAYWEGYFLSTARECNTAKELQDHLNKLGVNRGVNKYECIVCARGGMMLSQIRLGNRVSPTHSELTSGSKDIVDGFSMESFCNMETIYEGYASADTDEHPFSMNTHARLVNICLNVIVNGDFHIEDHTNYVAQFEMTDVIERYQRESAGIFNL